MDSHFDIDDKVAFLSELFPNESLELIFNSLLEADGDTEMTISLILADEDNPKNDELSVFDHLVNTFPDVEIEAIEAFLLIHADDLSSEATDLNSITRAFMKQLQKTKKARDRDLKMKLSDFNSLLRSSNESNWIRTNYNKKVGAGKESRAFEFTCKFLKWSVTYFLLAF